MTISENDFLELLAKEQNIIHKITRIYAQDEASQKDLFQEISIQLWKSYPSFKGNSKFTTWMYRVGLNTAITLYRKDKKVVKGEEFTKVSDLKANEEYDDTKELQIKWLYEKIDTFSEIEKALILLYLEEKKYSEIAETLGISEVNARVKISRLKIKLKKML
ncbi:sigma-70 family RNA polymerase sigma factor [Flavobacteriaceae bacterium]|nr:sigma-70 family RNA polymerase sigma factor [Flavobacteriaceae bacterium]